FMTIGVMWLNHHRLFALINKKDDGLIAFNLLLLLGITWLPFPTAVLADHFHSPHADQQTAALVYAGSFFAISIVFTVMWRYAVARPGSACAADDAATRLQFQGSDDSRSRRSAFADGDPHADQSNRAASHSLSPNTIRGAERSAGPGSNELEGAGAGRLHLRH